MTGNKHQTLPPVSLNNNCEILRVATIFIVGVCGSNGFELLVCCTEVQITKAILIDPPTIDI